MSRKKRNSHQKYSKSYYNYGSEAYEYYPEEQDYKRRTHRVKRKTNQKRKVQKKSKSNSKHIHKTHYQFVKEKKGDFKTYFSIVTLFVFIISFVCIFAINNKKELEINANIVELKRLEESNSVLKTEMTKNINLEEVEKAAKERLNMQKPAPHQIVYINIPKQSYTVQYNLPQEEDEDEFSLSKIWKNLFGD